jgi:hypothetical protein
VEESTYEGNYRFALVVRQPHLRGVSASLEEGGDSDLEVVQARALVSRSLGDCPLQLRGAPLEHLLACTGTLRVQ